MFSRLLLLPSYYVCVLLNFNCLCCEIRRESPVSAGYSNILNLLRTYLFNIFEIRKIIQRSCCIPSNLMHNSQALNPTIPIIYEVHIL